MNGRWRTISRANDLARHERERAFLIAIDSISVPVGDNTLREVAVLESRVEIVSFLAE